MGRKGAPSDRQRRWALAKREYRRQKREERTQKECVVPDVIKLHVLTVQSNFARLTFHGVKKTHVEINGILAGREGDYVAMRVSKRAKKTCFAEYIEKGSESKLCDASEKCGCNERGHIVGIVRLGQTHKVCRKKAGEDSWLRQTCCRLNEAHIFVSSCVCMFVYCAFVSAKGKQNQKISHSTIYTEFPVASRYTSTNDARTDCRCWTQAATSL
jgi:hypothetical protein